MDIVLIFNGLGNQMSQYAFYLAKKEAGCRCVCAFDPASSKRHNGSELDRVFGIKYEINSKLKFYLSLYRIFNRPFFNKLAKLFGIKFYYEPRNYDYTPAYLQSGNGWLNFYFGGWHSEKYFKYIRDIVLEHFCFDVSKELDIEFKELVKLIKANSSKAISLHIRRGDYLLSKPGDLYQYGGVATIEYYNNAINLIRSMISNPVFFIFSNDIKWCRENFIGQDFHFVECNYAEKSWRDMYLMSLCRYHIIANSSFSWWGAWLCPSEDGMTLCPNRFLANIETKDFYPENWIKVV